MKIRDAIEADIPGILAIYNDAVSHTTAIWNENLIDAENRLAWLNNRRQVGYPVLVATDDAGQVLGFASFGDWRAWDGYRHTVEHSVYVKNSAQRSGIGKSLMTELVDRARTIGKHAMVAGIEAQNFASIKLHERLGFQTTGTLTEVGTKFGRWLDLTFMQLLLDSRQNPDLPKHG